MKKNIKKFVILLLSLACLICNIGLIGCSIGCSEENNKKEFGISESVVTLMVSETKEIKVSGVEDNSLVSWEIVDTSIATIDNGVITAVSLGRTVLRVSYEEQVKDCVIIVMDIGGLPVLALDTSKVQLFKGQTLNREGQVLFNGNAVETVNISYSSSDNNVATYVDGVITAIGKGEATLTVKAEYFGEEMEESITVEIVDYLFMFDSFNFDLFTNSFDGKYQTEKELNGKLITSAGVVDNATFSYTTEEDFLEINGNVVSVIGGFEGTNKKVKINISCQVEEEIYFGELNLNVIKTRVKIDDLYLSIANSPSIELPVEARANDLVLVNDIEWEIDSVSGNTILLKEESPFGTTNYPYDKKTKLVIVTDTIAYETEAYVYTLYIDDSDSMSRFVEIGSDVELQTKYANATIAFGANIDYGMEMLNGLFSDVEFNGSIDGKGYSIYSFSTKNGPFRNLGKQSIIKNLGLINVNVVDVEKSSTYDFNIAGGVFASNKGIISDCYFDIKITTACANATAIGAVSSLRDKESGLGTISNCMVISNFADGLLSRTSATGAFVSVQDAGVTTNNFFVSNYPKRSAYDGAYVPKTLEELEQIVSDYGLNGNYWLREEGYAPKLVHMDEIRILDTIELGEQSFGRYDEGNKIDISATQGDISKITVDDVSVNYIIEEDTAVLSGKVFENSLSTAKVKVFTNTAIYLINVNIIDLIIKTKADIDTLVEWGTDPVKQAKYAGIGIVVAANVDYENGVVNGLFKDVPFNGYLDGNGYVLSNINTKIGLFRRLGANAVIKNIGFENINVVGAEDSATCYPHRLASGVFGENLGTIANCSFKINFTAECVADGATLYGGLSTLRDYSFDTGNITKCILEVNFAEEILSVDNAGAAFACNDSDTWNGNWDNYVVTNMGRAWRTAYANNYARNVYSTRQALLDAVSDFGFTADCWKIVQGELPTMKNK